MTPSHDPKTETLTKLLQPCRGVILDFDGLLADSEPFHYKAYNAVFEKYGHTIDPDEYWVEFTSKGKGIQGEIDRYGLELAVSPQEMRQQKFERYAEFCESGAIPLFPQAREFIEILDRKFDLVIASGSWEKDIRAILRHADAESLFETILGKGSAEREKPHPDIFLKAVESLGHSPGQCLVVEDALKGLSAAKQAGIPCIIILNPLNRGIDFSEADLVFSGMDELIESLRKLGLG